ncbi:DMT family transporter [Sediminicola luteus]|uniref:EamA family transporter n=1 Tax=Sediminicola luteus TaxID=319238 RepID=A0A2A4G4I9_9FLAO|nr:EamA family transporter [Sediminicola luteus]PCE63577.1 EamA family transporter [Sediminicola luteus]
MPSVKLKNYLHLHFIVFIWGFTAVLGKLIQLDAIPLVWYRMAMATLLVWAYLKIRKIDVGVSKRELFQIVLTGCAIALHWITFFQAIKVSNVSIALSTLSAGAFMTALLEPIWFKRKLIGYELVLGILVVLGLGMIFYGEGESHAAGIGYGLLATFLGAVFSISNGQLVKSHAPSVIAFYELGVGALLVTVFIAFRGGFVPEFFQITLSDAGYLFLLASICTAYAFIGGVKVMRYISPYTVMLTTNLEPVYGILMAFIIFGQSEHMGGYFYLGALLILVTVLANGVLKNRIKKM